MKIIIDNRENALIPLIEQQLNKEQLTNITYETQVLDIGDIHIHDNDNTLIFERKTVADLAASISDGRYNEQSFRLNSLPIHNHNIYYIIEGSIKSYNSKYSHIKPNTLYSSLFTLSYYKGFSVYKTDDIYETSQLIVRIADKLFRENKNAKKLPYYKDSETTQLSENSNNDYVETLKVSKKSFINKNNIAKIMLMQIPNVSINSANIITNKYKTIIDLICALQDNINCLNDLTYNTCTGKSRKISKTCIKNIQLFLLNDD